MHFTFISLVEIQSYTGDFDSPQFCQISLNLWAETIGTYLRQVHLLSWPPRWKKQELAVSDLGSPWNAW